MFKSRVPHNLSVPKDYAHQVSRMIVQKVEENMQMHHAVRHKPLPSRPIASVDLTSEFRNSSKSISKKSYNRVPLPPQGPLPIKKFPRHQSHATIKSNESHPALEKNATIDSILESSKTASVLNRAAESHVVVKR